MSNWRTPPTGLRIAILGTLFEPFEAGESTATKAMKIDDQPVIKVHKLTQPEMEARLAEAATTRNTIP